MIEQLRVVLIGPGPALTASPVLEGKIRLAGREMSSSLLDTEHDNPHSPELESPSQESWSCSSSC